MGSYLDKEQIRKWVEAASYGDQQAFRELIRQYVGLVRGAQKGRWINLFGEDDWQQAANYCLVIGLESYKSNPYITFGLYYRRLFKNRISTLVRQQCAQKRQGDQQAVPLYFKGDGELNMEAGDWQGYHHSKAEQHVILSEGLESRYVNKVLTEEERLALALHIMGYELSEIACQLDENLEQVGFWVRRGSKKFYQYLEKLLYDG